jgi:hypothetical protein
MSRDDLDKLSCDLNVASPNQDISWEPADMIVCVPAPAGVLAAWTTAAACLASPAGLVVGAGGMNGVNVDAVADALA